MLGMGPCAVKLFQLTSLYGVAARGRKQSVNQADCEYVWAATHIYIHMYLLGGSMPCKRSVPVLSRPKDSAIMEDFHKLVWV